MTVAIEHSPYGRLVGTEVLQADPVRGEVEVAYQASEQFTNRIGTVAGAMIAGMLDSVTGLVANLEVPEGFVAVHKTLSVNYLRPIAPGRVRGRGRVVHRSQREVRTVGELIDDDANPLASAEAVLRIIARPGP